MGSDGEYDPLPISLDWLVRWGTVGRDGVHVRLPLTHEVLGMLVGARRPTVTTALQRLRRSGLLAYERPDHWLLTNRAIECLGTPESLELIDDGGQGAGGPDPLLPAHH